MHETGLNAGGHFTALEVDDAFIEDVRSFFRQHY